MERSERLKAQREKEKQEEKKEEPAAPSNELDLATALNIGTVAYVSSKNKGEPVGLSFLVRTQGNRPGFELRRLPVRSPRVGVIQIFDAYFTVGAKALPDPLNLGAPGNSVVRLATLFHEARHSDGNGAHTGFFHGYCPATHDLSGLPGCDFNLNGPYSIQASVLESLMISCVECGLAEATKLRLAYADTLSRVIRAERWLKEEDQIMELVELMKEKEDMIDALMDDKQDPDAKDFELREAIRLSLVVELQREIKKLRKRAEELYLMSDVAEKPSVDLDPTPEGL